MTPTRDNGTIAMGGLTALLGGAFVLQGLGVLDFGEAANGPAWVVIAAGAVFLAGGIAVAVKGAAPGARLGETLGEICGIVASAGLAAIGTWVAFAGEPEGFGSGQPLYVTAGRIAFGLGSAITWLATFGFVWQAVKKRLPRP